MGFKGVKKSTPYAAQMVAEVVVKKAKDMGLQRAEVFVKGPGTGRESAIRAVINLEVDIIALHDITPSCYKVLDLIAPLVLFCP
jgi:small subunit ribosomal protein S11